MQVNFFTKGLNCLVAKVSGELDHHVAVQVRTQTDSRLARGRARNLIFDFSDLNFMDSSGIGVVIGRYKLVKSSGGEVAIVCPNLSVNKILHMSGIPKIMGVYPSFTDVPEKLLG